MLQNNYTDTQYNTQLLRLCSRAHGLQLLKPTCSRAQEPQLMSSCATVTKPVHPRAVLHRKGRHRNEQPEPRNSWGAPAPQLETARVQQRRPSRNKEPEISNKQTNDKFKKCIEIPFQNIAQIFYYLPVLEIRSPKSVLLGQNEDVNRAMLSPEAVGENSSLSQVLMAVLVSQLWQHHSNFQIPLSFSHKDTFDYT